MLVSPQPWWTVTAETVALMRLAVGDLFHPEPVADGCLFAEEDLVPEHPREDRAKRQDPQRDQHDHRALVRGVVVVPGVNGPVTIGTNLSAANPVVSESGVGTVAVVCRIEECGGSGVNRLLYSINGGATTVAFTVAMSIATMRLIVVPRSTRLAPTAQGWRFLNDLLQIFLRD